MIRRKPVLTKRRGFMAAGMLLLFFALSRVVSPGDEPQRKTGEEATSPLAGRLKIESLSAQAYTPHLTLYGVTEANRHVALKAQTDGAVVEISPKEGKPVTKGEVLLRLDERDRRARLAEAQALLHQRKIQYEAARRLEKKGFGTEVRYAESAAAYEQAKALLRRTQLDLQYTRIVAPFDGVLENLAVEIGDVVMSGAGERGNPVATVVDIDPLVVSGQVPQHAMPFLDRATVAEIHLPGSEMKKGRIRYLASVADPVSRTFRIEVEIPNPQHAVQAGLGAELKLPLAARQAYLVPSSVLSLADSGDPGVKLVDQEGFVRFKPVDIIEETQQGLWISGIPEHISLITLGAAYVNDGERVPEGSVKQKPK